MNNAQYHTHADCMKEKISDRQQSDYRRARGHFTCKQQDYKYVLMFVSVYFCITHMRSNTEPADALVNNKAKSMFQCVVVLYIFILHLA